MDAELTRSETDALLERYNNPDASTQEQTTVDWDPSFLDEELVMGEPD